MMPTTFKEFLMPCQNKTKCQGDLLFIHGFCVEHSYFTAAKELSKYFNIYMIDLPGHGTNTSGVTHKDLKIKKIANYIVTYIEHKKLNNFYLMGHSMGGGLVSLVANAVPQKIKKLFLLCPANPAALHAGFKSFYIFYPKNMEQKNRLLKCLYAPNNFKIFSQNPKWVEFNKKQLEFQLANWKNMKKLFQNMSVSVLTSIKKAQKNIKVPTMLMVGHYDQTIPPKHTLKFFSKHLSSDLLTTYEFQNSGHLIFEEESKLFVEKVLGFVK